MARRLRGSKRLRCCGVVLAPSQARRERRLYGGAGYRFVLPEGPARVTEQAKLAGEAEAVGRAATDRHGREVGVGKGVMANNG